MAETNSLERKRNRRVHDDDARSQNESDEQTSHQMESIYLKISPYLTQYLNVEEKEMRCARHFSSGRISITFIF